MTAKRRQQCREAQRRYEKTANGKATLRRYRQTDAGRKVARKSAAKRLLIGQRYIGRVATMELAQAINRHIKRRRREFVEDSKCRSVETPAQRKS